MGHALVSVSASNEEHGRTVGNSTDNGAAGDDSTGRVNLAAGADVASHGTTITRSTSGSSTWLGGRIGRAVVTRKLASGERACRVDQGGKIVYRRILIVPEGIRRVAKLSCELRLQVRRDGEQSQSGDETLVLHGVERFESEVLDFSG